MKYSQEDLLEMFPGEWVFANSPLGAKGCMFCFYDAATAAHASIHYFFYSNEFLILHPWSRTHITTFDLKMVKNFYKTHTKLRNFQ